jgi:hypothetical protein
MYGPAARCKRLSSIRQITVLHQCIRPLIGACAPGHHGYQRACDLISGQASTGPFGSPVFACAGKTDPPSSSHPLADLGGQTKLRHRLAPHLALRCSFVRAWRPFLRPDLRATDAPRAGAVKAGRRAGPAPRVHAARPRLVRPRARREDYAGRDAIASVLTHVKARPLLRTAHATRASLLASAIARTL